MVYECFSKLLILTTSMQCSSSEDSSWNTRRHIPCRYWKESFIIIFKMVRIWPPIQSQIYRNIIASPFFKIPLSITLPSRHTPIILAVALQPNSGPDARCRQLRTSDQYVTEYYPHNTQRAYEAIIRTLSGIRNYDPINRVAADLHSRHHGHRDQSSALFL